MAYQKLNTHKYTSATTRRSCLKEYLDAKIERRKSSYKNWIIAVICVIGLHYSYTYYWFSKELGSPTALEYRGDEYLTTKSHDHPEAIATNATRKITTLKKPLFYKSGITYKVIKRKEYKLPYCIRTKYVGGYILNTTRIDPSVLNDVQIYPMVQNGGYYRPPNCSAKYKVAIIVPYRGREDNLGIFLYNLHPFLMEQKLEYQIFVIEQSGNDLFNKGRLYNVGFKEIQKLNNFECMVFHDLDLLPTNLEILYTCPTLPRHMCAAVNDTEFRKRGLSYKFKSLFGGVVSIPVEMFVRANGYSNLYFGWGGEDNDMFWRLRAAGYPVVRYNKSIGVFAVLPHTRAPVNTYRFHLLVRAVERYKVDGLTNLEYIVESKVPRALYTHIVANINPRNENITALTARWTAGDNSF